MRVLFIDDEIDTCKQAKLFLEQEREKLNVETTTSPKKALKKLNVEDYDAIVSDYQMPEMDGVDLLNILREERNDDRPFIFFTGKGREDVAMEALNLGANRYFRKGGSPTSQYGLLAKAIVEEVKAYRERKELREKRKRMNAVFDASSEIIFMKNSEGEYENVNDRFLEVFGISRDEIIGKTDHEIFPEDLAEELREEDNKVMEKGKPIRELHNLPTNEKKLVFDTRKVPLTEKEEGIEGVCGFAKDVTQLKTAEDKAEELIEFRERIIEDVNAWFTVFDADGKILVWNEAAEEISGYSSEEAINNEKILNLLIPDEEVRKEFLDNVQELLDGEKEKIENFEKKIRTKEGDQKIISWSFRVLGKSGDRERIVLIGQDVTERKKKTEKLEEQKEEFKKIFDFIPVPLHTLDEEGIIRDVNDAALDVLGYEKKEIIGTHFTEAPFVTEKSRQNLQDIFEKVGREGKPIGPIQTEAETKDGEILKGNMRVVPMFDKWGFAGIIASVSPVSDLEEGREEGETRGKEFLDLFNRLNNSVFIHDVGGNLLRINDSACDRLGYSREDLYEMDFYELFSQDFSNEVEGRMEEVIEGDEVVLESVLVTKGGRKIPVEINSELIEYEGKDAILTIGRDISERKETEFRRLRESLISMTHKDIVNDINEEFAYCPILYREITSFFPEPLSNLDKWKNVVQIYPRNNELVFLSEESIEMNHLP